MPSIEVNGINIYYEIHGKGKPVIFANGIFANTLSWFNQTPIFSKKYQVILYDMRGQGKSDKPEEVYSFDLHVEDQKALLEKLNISKVDHIGISYGAELGLAFALKYPDMLRSLTVCSGVSYIGPYLNQVAQLWREACILANPLMFYHSTVPFNFSETYINNNITLLEQAKERYALFNYPAFVRLLDAFLELNITDQIHKNDIPTCIIGGEKDILKPPYPYSMIMHEKIPNSELVIIPQSGHVVTWEKPEEFNSIVLGFLEKQNI